MKTDYGEESIIYEKDFSLTVMIYEVEEKSYVLIKNRNVETIFGLLIHLSEMKQTMRREKDERGGEWSTLSQCYKVTFENKGQLGENIDFQKFGVDFEFSFNTTPTMSLKIDVNLSSEKNSYGVVKGKWFDGKTKRKWRESYPSLQLLPHLQNV